MNSNPSKMVHVFTDTSAQPVSHNAIVILGASGDLAKRKLIPALTKLFSQGVIDKSSIIVGSGRSNLTHETFREHLTIPSELSDVFYYHQGIPGLKHFISQKGEFTKTIFFMALPPEVYSHTAEQLFNEGFTRECRLIIEKPFGYDFRSARELNTRISQYFNESQIYRIDHYLAKEAIQNILVFRFANAIFSPIWNSKYIESIQINAYEDIGVENRGAYFDHAGIIRDMVQNHLIQLLCLLTMEAPVSLHAEDIRMQKINILKTITISESCKYQYKGYLQEKGVANLSQTETCAEIKLFINNFRWAGMPIFIRTGKALTRKGTEIGIQFKTLPKILFNHQGNIAANKIIFKIQPAEGIIVDLSTKVPGGHLEIANTNMAFCYRHSFASEIPEAYQKLLLDALYGDKTLFVSAQETEIAWQKFDHILSQEPLEYYEKGTVPSFSLGENWINFDAYKSICE